MANQFDYSASSTGINHTIAFFSQISTDYINASDLKNDARSSRTVTVHYVDSEGVSRTTTQKAQFKGAFWGDPVAAYMPAASFVYAIDLNQPFGFRLNVAAPLFPDIRDFVQASYNSLESYGTALGRYYDACFAWYNKVDALAVTSIDFAGLTGESGHFTLDQAIRWGDGSGIFAAAQRSDSITGSNFADQIEGLGGNDSIQSGIGADKIWGGAGNDSVTGGAGNDVLLGEQDNDTLLGETGNDSLDGGDGNDSLSGGIDDDTLSGGTGNDCLLGALGNDSLAGAVGDDLLTGDAGNDSMYGADGNDSLDGGDGIDRAIYKDESYLNFNSRMRGQFGDVYVEHLDKSGKVVLWSEEVMNTELFEFKDHVFKVDEAKASLVGVRTYANGHFNQWQTQSGSYVRLTSASLDQDYVFATLGDPATADFKTNLKLGKFYVTQDKEFGLNIRGYGYSLAVQSLKEIFDDVKAHEPGLLDHISTAGMHNYRTINNSSKLSLHSWGIAIDLRVDGLIDGLLPSDDDGRTYDAIAQLIPYFNAHGWMAGAGFKNEDDMHFEVSDQLLHQWQDSGLIV